MSNSEKRTEELLDRLVLQIKALVLLQGTDAELKLKLQRKIGQSQDESVKKFVGALQRGAPPQTGRTLAIALGELILASLLVLGGTVALVPSVVGINTPSALLEYLAAKTVDAVGASPLSPYVSALEFVVGGLLMLSAFFALREAALQLKNVGLAVKSGEG